jgi:5-methylcytosine-specific restriction enzyme A
MSKNPAWTREELLLALDLLFRLGKKSEGAKHPEVVRLSQALGGLPLHRQRGHFDTFRSPSSVAMKLANFLAHDPDYSGVGLTRGNRLERNIWDEYSSDPERLREVATAIVAGSAEASTTLETSNDEFVEGDVLARIHLLRERDERAVAAKKKEVHQRTERLECEVCGFDFELTYGELGRGFAECHHTLPLSQAVGRRKVRLSDLAILCANCHRMIHRTRPLMSVEEFRASYRVEQTETK